MRRWLLASAGVWGLRIGPSWFPGDDDDIYLCADESSGTPRQPAFGCVEPFNRFWVFFAATTNVAFQVQVTDTQTGLVKPYSNPQGMVALPVADTQAFATCP